MVNAESSSSPSSPILSTNNPVYCPSLLSAQISTAQQAQWNSGPEESPLPGNNGTNDTESSFQFHQPQVVTLWGPVGSEEGAAAPRSRQEPGAEEPGSCPIQPTNLEESSPPTSGTHSSQRRLGFTTEWASLFIKGS